MPAWIALRLTEGATDDRSLCEPASLDWPGNAFAVELLCPSVYRKAVAITLPGFEGWSERASGPGVRINEDIYGIGEASTEAVSTLVYYKACKTIALCMYVLSTCRTSLEVTAALGDRTGRDRTRQDRAWMGNETGLTLQVSVECDADASFLAAEAR